MFGADQFGTDDQHVGVMHLGHTRKDLHDIAIAVPPFIPAFGEDRAAPFTIDGFVEQDDRHEDDAKFFLLRVIDQIAKLIGRRGHAVIEVDVRAFAVLLTCIDDQQYGIRAGGGDFVHHLLVLGNPIDPLNLNANAAEWQAFQ